MTIKFIKKYTLLKLLTPKTMDIDLLKYEKHLMKTIEKIQQDEFLLNKKNLKLYIRVEFGYK